MTDPTGRDGPVSRRFPRLDRRRFLGALGLTAGGLTTSGMVAGSEQDQLEPAGTGTEDLTPAELAAMPPEQRIRELRSRFFTGPVNAAIDLTNLDPNRRPEDCLLGACAEFQHGWDDGPSPEDLTPFAVAAGLKWLRTGYRVRDWNDRAGRPKDYVRRWFSLETEHGIRPLLQTNAHYFLGTDEHDGKWHELVANSVEYWGDRVGGFQFDNEPHIPWGQVYGGGYWGGPWLEHYTRFVEAVSQRLKADYPQTRLVNGAHLPAVAIAQFMRSNPAVDGVDWHHYSYKGHVPPEFTRLAKDDRFPQSASPNIRVVRVAADYVRRSGQLFAETEENWRQHAPQLWMTETGIPSAPVFGFEPPADTLAPLTPGHQAKWLARMAVVALLSSIRVFFYTLWDPGPHRSPGVVNYGLVTRELEPKPAFWVLGRVSALTDGLVTVDTDFHATVRDVELGDGHPWYDRMIGPAKEPERQVPIREDIRLAWLIRADGRALLAFWSTHPVRQPFPPRKATVTINRSLGERPILVDAFTGDSRHVTSRERTSDGAGERLVLDVYDYPRFILADTAGEER